MKVEKNQSRLSYLLRALLVLVLAAVLAGTAEKAYAAKNTSVEPQASWTEDEWAEYKKSVKAALPKGKYAIYVSLDGKPISGYKLYQSTGSYVHDLDNKEYFSKMDTLSGFPGVYLFDSKTMNEKYYVRIYKEKETDGYNDENLDSFYESSFGSDSFASYTLYTVSFEDGDIKCRNLPKTCIVRSGEWISPKYENEDRFNRRPGYLLDGYYFKYWADSDGNEVVHGIEKPSVLHPVYCDELEVSEYDYGQYYDIYEHMVYDGTAEKVSKASQFSDALAKTGFVEITGDVTLTGETKGSTNYYSSEGTPGRFYANNNTIIIKKGATLTIDGATLNREYGFGGLGKIIVQTGGTLQAINGSGLNYFDIVVMPKATFNIDGSHVEYEALHNYGTINISNAINEKFYCNLDASEQLLFHGNGGNGNFFNAEGATITVSNNSIFEIYSNTYSDYENVNRGTISLYDDGRLIFKGDSSNQNQDRREVTPFINLGTINVCCTPNTSDKYSDGKMELSYAKLLNKGTISITPKASQWWEENTPELSKNRFLDVSNSELFNEGTIDMKLKDSFGISVSGCYIDKTSYAAPCDYDEYAYIENRKGGVIKAELEKGAHAIIIEQKNSLKNYGSITLNSKTDTFRDTAIVLSGTLLNKGTLKGKGSIGYCRIGYANISEFPPKYTGNKTSLTSKFGYRLDTVDKNGSGIYEPAKITIDGETVRIKSFSDGLFFFKTGSQKIKVEVDGYKDYSGTVKAAKSLSAFLKGNLYFKVTLTAGGAKKSVKSCIIEKSAYPYIGYNVYPGIIAKDGKGNIISPNNYTVNTPSEFSKIGDYKITVTFTNGFAGTKKLSLQIVPMGTYIKSITGASKSLKVSFAEQTNETSYYEVQACKDSKFKSGVKTAKTSKNTVDNITIKGLSAKTSYYVRIRTAKKVGKKTYYSDWKTFYQPVKTK